MIIGIKTHKLVGFCECVKLLNYEKFCFFFLHLFFFVGSFFSREKEDGKLVDFDVDNLGSFLCFCLTVGEYNCSYCNATIEGSFFFMFMNKLRKWVPTIMGSFLLLFYVGKRNKRWDSILKHGNCLKNKGRRWRKGYFLKHKISFWLIY